MTTRILYVDHADLMGGAEQSLLRLMAGLDRSRYTPMLAGNPDTPIYEAARLRGIATHPVELEPLRGNLDPIRVARTWQRGVAGLRHVIREEGVHLLHSNVMRA